ncbi:uncharacterized protein [Aegilops tauschii subsp. strangulata]|uniref:uncharacterized protein isoform X1 n=1 Tax=Aegilops tauschii subsp. strangulata TaxID=200361 RepID=UPI001E1CA453|nr:uncharacterized protein LOC120968444 isoform X1 [Aegilops tauschii subsp. strangulata]
MLLLLAHILLIPISSTHSARVLDRSTAMSSSDINTIPAANHEEQSLAAPAPPHTATVAEGKGKVLAQQAPAPVVRKRRSGRDPQKSPPPAATREELESRESREGPLKVLALPAPGAPRTHAVSGDKMMRRARARTLHANAVSNDKMVSRARAPTLHANPVSDDKMMDGKNEMAPVQGVPPMRGSIAASSSVGGVVSENAGSLAAGKMAPRGAHVSMMNNHNFDLNELPTEHEQLQQEQPPKEQD